MSKATLRNVSPHTTPFVFEEKHIKTYPHLDAIVSLSRARAMNFDINEVAKYSFLPLLKYVATVRRPPKSYWVNQGGEVLKKSIRRAPKPRPIAYASHKDALLLKYYREQLSPFFEMRLNERGLQNCVVAYRKIPKDGGDRNKSNIQFAAKAFRDVQSLKNCVAVAVDISGYFNNIEHELLETKLKEVLGVSELSKDWQHIFNNVTRYKTVDLESALISLGYVNRVGSHLEYAVKPKNIPKQLCTNKQYRQKIVPLVILHDKTHGIPQGLPISDILANLFLIDVDQKLNQFAISMGGYYYRYSDDIMMILPGGQQIALDAESLINQELNNFSSCLEIREEKTEIAIFEDGASIGNLVHVKNQPDKYFISKQYGISYLGFRYDGRRVYIRENTITNLRRKVIKSSKAFAYNHVQRYNGKTLEWLIERLDIEKLKRRFLKIENFGGNEDLVDSNLKSIRLAEPQRNFLTYLKRSEEEFLDFETNFSRQIRNVSKLVEDTTVVHIRRAHASRKHLNL